MNFNGETDISCVAPCSMYSVLKETGRIPDPFFGTNELELRHLSEKECTFHTTFEVDNETLSRDYVQLIFYGLDTICDIYLNDKKLDHVMNMHRTYVYDVKQVLKETNYLRLEFYSPVRYFEEMNQKHYLFTNYDTIPGAAHLRKALYMSGWDWGPTLPDMGIFRPVELCAYNTDRLGDVSILQYHENNQVRLVINAETRHNSKDVRVFAEVDGKTVEVIDGGAEVIIESPKLWWPNGFGNQNLYDVIITLVCNQQEIDRVQKTIGLRTLTLSTAAVEGGNEFCFVVNGVKIFAKGANYVPMDNLLSTITDDRLERIVNDCLFAHFNCVRVWGGGYYPEDKFYELCDRAGLIVWQDLMIACINVWMRPDFEKEIMAEAEDNIKRIRHHASLGLLCGNNEMEEAVCNWGIGKSQLVRIDYLKLYEQLFPNLCEKLAPQTFYLSSSPTSGGGFDDPQANNRGDVHFWSVWNGGAQFDEYRKFKFRFCSEYGFESQPSIKTIDYFCPQEERNLLSFTMENHQKHKNGNPKMLSYLAHQYQLPGSLENAVYASQLNQGTAIKYGVEHFRRIRGYCMGSVYWQLNDCWPVASWSSVDYFGRYKALHYYARKFYAPVAMGLFAENGNIVINVANETTRDFHGRISVGIMNSEFTSLWSDAAEICVEALSSSDVCKYSVSLMEKNRDRYFYADLYDENGCFIMRQTELSTKPKYFIFKKPIFDISCESGEGGVWISVSSNVFAKNVELSWKNYDIVLSDNYFDIATTNAVRVFAKTNILPEKIKESLMVRSVYDIPFGEAD